MNGNKLHVLHSEQDASVNFVEEQLAGFLEARYVRRAAASERSKPHVERGERRQQSAAGSAHRGRAVMLDILCPLRHGSTSEETHMRATIEQAIEAIAELLTATHDHGSWKPGIVLSYLGPNFDNGEGWYVSLTEYKADRLPPPGYPVKSVIFKGKYQTLREGLKAAAEFLAPTKLDELKTRVQALAEKL